MDESNPYLSPMTTGAASPKRSELQFLRYFWIVIPAAMVVGAAIGSTVTFLLLNA